MGCFGISLREETWGLGRPNETWGCSKCRHVCDDCYSEVALIKIWIENANPKSISNQVLPSGSFRTNRSCETPYSSCVDLCSTQTATARNRTVLCYRLFLYHDILKHIHTHIERAPKRSEAEAVGGGSVWSNPSRKVSKAECRTSNT